MIRSAPASFVQSTSGATTSDVERQLVRKCANGAPRKGVWFRYTATDTFWLKVDTKGSSYEAFFVAMAGRPAPDHLVTCGETFGEVHVQKGTTYWFMVHAANPGSGGGTLRIRFAPELPPPKAWVHVNSTGVAKVRNCAARISGTAGCQGAESWLSGIAVEVVENAGTATGDAGAFHEDLLVRCGDTPISWQGDAFPDAGPFAPGPVAVRAGATAFNVDTLSSVTKDATVTLRLP